MAYTAGGTDYGTHLRSRAQADERLSGALRRKGERDRQARIKKSGQRSGLQKLVSAGVRGAAAYYTGGMSEQMGAGSMIDEAMLGTDSEGRAVRNEYGDLVGAGASVYQAGKSMQDMKLAKQDAKFDKLASRRSDIANMLFESGDKSGGMKMLREIENMEGDYMGKRKGLEGANPFQYSDEDYSALQPQMMTREQRAAKRAELGQGGSSAVAPPTVLNPASTQPQYGQYGASQQPQKVEVVDSTSGMPAKPDARQGPSQAEIINKALKQKKKQDAELEQEASSPQSEYGAKHGWDKNPVGGFSVRRNAEEEALRKRFRGGL